jgi:epoxyqueuosine reductase
MSQAQYENWFGGTALTRAKHEGLVRNALIHLFETNRSEALKIATERQHDTNPVIKETCAQIIHSQLSV